MRKLLRTLTTIDRFKIKYIISVLYEKFKKYIINDYSNFKSKWIF